VPPDGIVIDDQKMQGGVEYRRHLKQFFPEDKPNFVSLEGYLNARVLVEGIRRAGPELDRERFIDAIESIEHLDLGIDNPLSFSAMDHQGLDGVYITQYHDGRLQWLAD